VKFAHFAVEGRRIQDLEHRRTGGEQVYQARSSMIQGTLFQVTFIDLPWD
jgi:hypothetical protein